MLTCFDGEMIMDHEFRISLIRNKRANDTRHVFLLLEGFGDTEIGFDILRESVAFRADISSEGSAYKIAFMDFVSDSTIRVDVVNTFGELAGRHSRLMKPNYRDNDFKTISCVIPSAIAIDIYEAVIRQRDIQAAGRETPGYLYYSLPGGVSTPSNDRYYNCYTWAVDFILRQYGNININDNLGVVQRNLLRVIAHSHIALPNESLYQDNKSLITVTAGLAAGIAGAAVGKMLFGAFFQSAKVVIDTGINEQLMSFVRNAM